MANPAALLAALFLQNEICYNFYTMPNKKTNNGFESFEEIIRNKATKKPPAFPWQDLALRIIDELNIPPHKRNAVFLVCKKHPKIFIEKNLNTTKELCKEGEKWRYFFKLVGSK